LVDQADYVLVEQAGLKASGKVVGVIHCVLYANHIRHIKSLGLWYVAHCGFKPPMQWLWLMMTMLDQAKRIR
jgi:hypothetical protein